jgi:hypothetical protein
VTGEAMEQNTDKLAHAFRKGQLVRPDVTTLNFVDLANAFALLTEVEGIFRSSGALSLCRKIGKAEHYLFVLVDGLGMNLLRRLPQHGLLGSAVVAELQAVFLSTTASALATLATARWPCSHGIPGWWTRLKRAGITAVTLACAERSTQKPLSDFGVTVEDLLPFTSFWPGMRYEPVSILPAEIVDSPFSKRLGGGTSRIGYEDLKDAVRITSEAILSASGPSFTCLYLPHVDTMSHHEGPDHQAVLDQALVLEKALAEVVAASAGRARIVISADHGQVHVPEAARFVLTHDDPILRHLECAPTGETNVPIFHVLPDCEDSFEAEFSARFGNHFILLSLEQLERLRLLGPDNLSPVMKERMGDFVAIAQQPACLCVGSSEGSGFGNSGVHGGLSPAEMLVPLIIPA